MQMYVQISNIRTVAVCIEELSIYQLSILIDRAVWSGTSTFTCEAATFYSRCMPDGTQARRGIIVANRREQIFPVAVPSRDYGRAAYDHVERTH